MDPWLLPASLFVVWFLVVTCLLFYQAFSERRVKEGRSARGRRLLLALILGLILVAVPTVFAVFPKWAGWDLGLRILVIGAWLDAAAWAVYVAAISQDEDRGRVIRAEFRTAIAEQFRAMVGPMTGAVPEGYVATVYAPPVSGDLVPVYPRIVNLADPAIFKVGTGATGKAWRDRQDFVGRGDEVSNADHDLTVAQQRRYAMFRSIAATVILDAHDQSVGVLTVISRRDDRFFFDEDNRRVLHGLADAVAWLLPDAVKWMLPMADEVQR